MTYTIHQNQQFGSLEISFGGKPSEAIREALKALKFRWHNVKKVWYGFAEESDVIAILESNESAQTTESTTNARTAKKKALASLWNRCNVSALPAYGTDNEIKKTIREEVQRAGDGYDKHVAAYIRKHLRGRFPECKFSVTSGGAGYLDACDITIKSSPYSRKMVKGNLQAMRERDRWDHWENSDELDAVLNYCNKLHDSFDDDDGDIYADYGAHHDLYGSASIAYDYAQIEATEEQKASAADFATRKAEAEAAEEARRAAEWAEREKQIEKKRLEAEEREKIRTVQSVEITGHVTVEDLAEDRQIAVIGLLEGYGKENSLEEVRETINKKREEGNDRRADAVITRKIHFSDSRIFENFCTIFLHDWDFLAGFGGTATEDVRVNDDNFPKLNTEQREGIRFYSCNCIGIYLDGVFQFVIDPQGYGYARYVMMPDEYTDSYIAGEKLTEWLEESEQLAPFYFPAPIAEQIEQSDLLESEYITMFSLNPWTMTVEETHSILNSAQPKAYAQHSDAWEIQHTPRGRRKPESAYIYDNQSVIIYSGLLPSIPESLKYTEISRKNGITMKSVNFAGEKAKDFMISVIKYYNQLGYTPAIDTIQR